MSFNPLTTIRHICPTIFGLRRRCAYLQIAHERLKMWKKSAATFCSSWNCASNELNYRSIAIVVLKIGAVKVSRWLSEKLRKSQNLMVIKELTWSKFWNFFSKMPKFCQISHFWPKNWQKNPFWGNLKFFTPLFKVVTWLSVKYTMGRYHRPFRLK